VQLSAVFVLDGAAEQFGEGVPHGFFGGVAEEFHVVEHPGSEATAPADDMRGEAVVLGVHPGGNGKDADGAWRNG